MENNHLILEVLKRLFGSPKSSHVGQVQYEFNCPSSTCKNDKDKFNLNFNSERNIFNCFKCKYHGFVTSLIRDYGNEDDFKKFELLFPKSNITYSPIKKIDFSELKDDITCELPEGYRPLTEKYDSKYYYRAINYLKNRGITEDLIKKYEIGYTETGPRIYRIIIPSRNIHGEINYYEARSYFSKSLKPYYKPTYPNKLDIIFNVSNINFDLPVYLVEGVFDMFPLYNAIPLLGKDLSPLLLFLLIRHKSKVILCLDEDAIDDSIKLYNELSSYGIDVYFVEVKDDIAKQFELYGHEKIIEILKGYKKLNFQYLFELKLKEKKKTKNYSTQELNVEMEKIKKQFNELMNE